MRHEMWFEDPRDDDLTPGLCVVLDGVWRGVACA